MPEYLYRCPERHESEVTHRMLYSTGIVCECGLSMRRVIQASRINWNGNKAVGGTSPVVQTMIDEAPRKRDEFAERKAKHVKETRAEKERLARTDPTYGRVTHLDNGD